MLSFFYDFLWWLALPFILLRMLWRSRRLPAYRNRLLERLSIIPPLTDKEASYKTRLWLHAVSVGEFLAALPLIRELQARYPHWLFIVTTTTPTGSVQVKKHLGDTVYHVYVPYDIKLLMRRFLAHLNPKLLIILETELWLNMITCCKERSIPVLLLNARLSEKSACGYARVMSYTQSLWRGINAIAVSSKADAERFIELGYPQQQLTIAGNVKFDMCFDESVKTKGRQLRNRLGLKRPVLIAASTHSPEERLILEIHLSLLKNFPNLLTIIVPRHPDRFGEVKKLIATKDLSCVTHSEFIQSHDHINSVVQIFLADVMGELPMLYAASDVAFIGGSMIPHGGHNTIEPALLGVPAIVGPFDHNFRAVNELLLTVSGLQRVSDQSGLQTAIATLLEDSNLSIKQAEFAKVAVDQSRGALQRMIGLITEYSGA